MESRKLRAFESRVQLKESEILLMIGIWNSVSTNKESGIEYLESGIHRMKSRIQDCLGLPCMRQLTSYDNWHLYHFSLTGSVCSLGLFRLYITLKNVIFSPQRRSIPFNGLYEDTMWHEIFVGSNFCIFCCFCSNPQK